MNSQYSREADLFRALGHPKRLEILELLGHRRLTASAIQQMTGFPQANLSQHLRELKDTQAIVAIRSGKHILYRLAHPDVLQVIRLVKKAQTPKLPRQREMSLTDVQDPVCGMWVEPAATRWQALFKGATYFFCASGCQRKFELQPIAYA